MEPPPPQPPPPPPPQVQVSGRELLASYYEEARYEAVFTRRPLGFTVTDADPYLPGERKNGLVVVETIVGENGKSVWVFCAASIFMAFIHPHGVGLRAHTHVSLLHRQWRRGGQAAGLAAERRARRH